MANRKEAAPPAVEQEIRYCTNSAGQRIAYATTGAGPPLVRTANWLTHLEFELQSPVRARFYRDLSRHHLLVRYDERGNGLSDRAIETIRFEDMVDDLASVVDVLKLERFALLGISQGGPVSIAYAVEHPERVSHLILYGSYARGRLHRDDAEHQRRLVEAGRILIREGWGSDNPAFRQFFASQYVPDATAEQLRSYTEMQRVAATPEMAEKIYLATSNINVKHLLPRVRVPTLVLHRRMDRIAPFENGQELASVIPDARFVPLDGTNHLVLPDEPTYRVFVREIAAFLGDPPPPDEEEDEAPPKLAVTVKKIEEHAYYKIFGMLAAAASVASIVIWWLTR